MIPPESGLASQNGLFPSKVRECRSAPSGSFYRSDTTLSLESSSLSSSSSSSSSPEKTKKKKHKKKLCWPGRKVFYFIFGHAPEFSSWATSFSSYSKMKYLIIFFLESAFRSIGDVTFCSNPFSGLLIFIAMILSAPHVAFLAFITLAFGIETAVVILRIPMDEVRGGGVLFNSFLTGTVIGLLTHEDVLFQSPHIILLCMAVGILTTYIWRGVNGLLATHLDFPLLNAPFHISILLYMFSGIATWYKVQEIRSEGISGVPATVQNLTFGDYTTSNGTSFMMDNISSQINRSSGSGEMFLHETAHPSPTIRKGLHEESSSEIMKSNNAIEALNWEKVIYGIVLAPSQVFGTNSIMTSSMIYFAILLYSPIMLMQSLTGSTIGTLIGVCLSNFEQFNAVYNGSWGYNSLFTSAALGGFVVVFNIHSWLLSIVGSILTALLYSAMVNSGLPALGIPFMLTTWLLLPNVFLSKELNLNTKGYVDADEDDKTKAFPCKNTEPLLRLHLADITTPEWNRSLYKENQTRCGNQEQSNSKENDPTIKYSQTQNNMSTLPAPLIPQQHNSILPI